MGLETFKAFPRRVLAGYFNDYLVGHGIDIGCGTDKLEKPHFHLDGDIDGWDIEQGDAQYMVGVLDNYYDFVYSSHCLEHMKNPVEALRNWVRICKPGGFIFVAVPSEDLYEQGVWPSRFNGDHKTTWTVFKPVGTSWSPVSVNIETLPDHIPGVELIFAKVEDTGYDYSLPKAVDQSGGSTEVAIEFVLQKVG